MGQEHITRTIRNALKAGHISHAYLFSGPRGTGKTTVARLIAKSLNCINSPTDNPCGKCDACVAIQDGSFLDVTEIDAASNRGIDDIRALREHVQFATSQGKYKVYIIDEVHMLTQDASNALLKTLEEPPKNTVFVLATTEKHKVLPTIQSRCQVFDFRRLPTNLINRRLRKVAKKENISIDDKSIALLSKKARGALRDALVLLEQAKTFSESEITPEQVYQLTGYLPEQHLSRIVKSLFLAETFEALKELKKLEDSGFELRSLISLLQQAVIEILIYKNSDIYYPDWVLSKESTENLSSLVSGDKGLYLVDVLDEAERKVRYGEDSFLSLEVAFLKFHRGKQQRKTTVAEQEPAREKSPESKQTNKEQWKKFLEKIKKKTITLHAHLREAAVISISDKEVVIKYPKGFEDSVSIIKKKDNLELINKTLTHAFRRKMKLKIKNDTEDKSTPEKNKKEKPNQKAASKVKIDKMEEVSNEDINLDEVARKLTDTVEGKTIEYTDWEDEE